MTEEALQHAADWIADAERVVVSSGAGMSRESGIPTFRDAQEGLWARYDPQQLATEAGFRRDPARVWGWYQHRRAIMARCRPHAGHEALVRLERLVPEFAVVTQNIDGLHQAAGSGEVVELHGSIHRSKCLDRQHPLAAQSGPDAAAAADVEPPPCPQCGSPLRPDVVWFGEMLPEAATRRAWELAERCDVLLLVGTSAMVWPAAELPLVAARAGARVVEVNPEPSEMTRVADAFLQAPAGEALPALADRVQQLRAAG